MAFSYLFQVWPQHETLPKENLCFKLENPDQYKKKKKSFKYLVFDLKKSRSEISRTYSCNSNHSKLDYINKIEIISIKSRLYILNCDYINKIAIM